MYETNEKRGNGQEWVLLNCDSICNIMSIFSYPVMKLSFEVSCASFK